MKSIVLDGDKIAEAIQKAKDKMINGEYDNNDLILRGDALKAIRQRCISEHLPFKSNTPVGARVLDALAAVYQVKPYKEESKPTVWHDAQNDPPQRKRRIPVLLRILPLWQLLLHVPHNGSWTIFQWSLGR